MTRHILFIPFILAMSVASAGKNQPPNISFELNQGQIDPSVKFVARAGGYRLFLTGDAAVLAAPDGKGPVTMRLLDANQTPKLSGVDQQPGVSNYLLGADRANWVTGVKHYEKVRYAQVYPGIDVVYYGKDRRLEHDFVLAPGADYHKIRIRFDGAKSLRLDEDGGLVVETPFGEMHEPRPVIYQDAGNERKMIAGGYRLRGRDVSFQVGSYDTSQPLVIDPYIYFSTYLGGSGIDQPTSVAADGQGNAYTTGFTTSMDFPVKGPVLARNAGMTDVFVTKLDANTGAIVYSTYLGGSGADFAIQIKVDAAGSAYIAGTTQSSNFPVTPGAYQSTLNGPGNAFVAKLNPGGSALVYSTLIGGSGGETARGLDIDLQGSAYVVGVTFSRDFPVVSTGFGLPGGANGFIAKLNPAGSALMYSGAIGGSGFDCLESVAVNSLGEANVVGFTNSTDLPTTFEGSRWPQLSGGLDGFMVKLSPGTTGQASIEYISYYGGSDDDILSSVVVDPRDDVTVYVTGLTSSFDFPSPSGALISLGQSGTVPFMAKFELPGLIFVAAEPRIPPAARALRASQIDNYDWLQPPPDDCDGSGGDWGPLLKQLEKQLKDYEKLNTFLNDAGSVVLDIWTPFIATIKDIIIMIKDGADLCSSSPSSSKFHAAHLLPSLTPNAVASPTPLFAVNSADGSPVTIPQLPVGSPTAFTSVYSIAAGPFGSILMGVQTNDTTLPVSSNGAKAGAGAASGLTGYIIKIADSAPSAQVTSVLNGASFNTSSPVTPGSLISLFGQFPGVTATSATNVPLPTSLGGASATINGTPLPLYFVNGTQINAQLPWETGLGQATAIVTSGGTTSPAFTFNVAAASPGIFIFGANRAVAQNQDYSLNNTNNGAAVGSYITVYLTGGGAVSPSFATGAASPSSPLAQVSASSSATIGGQPAPILFLGMTPGIIGVVQANLQIPQLPAGNYSLVITIGGAQSNAPLVTLSN